MNEIDVEKLKQYCIERSSECQSIGERIIAEGPEDRAYWYGQSFAYLYIITCINRGDFAPDKDLTS